MTITRATTLALNAWTRANRRAAQSYYESNGEVPTYCHAGHPFDPEATPRPGRRPRCRVCLAENSRAYRARKKAA